MKIIPEDRQMYISARLWHEVQPKVDLAPFIYALHDGIDLSKYGAGLKKFKFTFLILKPEKRLFFPGTYFSKKNKTAEIAVDIDYDKALHASRSELFTMMENAYLEGIDQLKTIPLGADFDITNLKKDVQKIFSEDKWYEVAVPA